MAESFNVEVRHKVSYIKTPRQTHSTLFPYNVNLGAPFVHSYIFSMDALFRDYIINSYSVLLSGGTCEQLTRVTTVTCNCKSWWHVNTWLVSTLHSSITLCKHPWCSHLQGGCEIWKDATPTNAGKIASERWHWNNHLIFRTCYVDNQTNEWAVPLKRCWSDHLTGEGHHLSLTSKLSSILYHSRGQHRIACK